jgi:MerR family transcriptional regulator, aldehyde-responsive regulator
MGYTIKEASERLDLPPHTIRFYEKEGLLPFIQRDQHGYRIFEQKDLDWIVLMTCFRTTGMTVAALKQIVDLAIQGDGTLPQRKAILEEHKLVLQKRQLELDKAFEAVNHKLTIYDSRQKAGSDKKLVSME